jgi:cytochrome c peroxidase
MKFPHVTIAFVGLTATFLFSCGAQESDPGSGEPSSTVTIDASLLAGFAPLPAHMNGAVGTPSEAQIALGKRLYFETKLSKDGSLSCNSCHGLDTFGVDNAQFSSGVGGQLGGRNAPTVMNAAGHLAQFWDGRAANVEEQAKGPILNPVEMAMESAEQVVAILKAEPSYVADFAAAFPDSADALTYDNLGVAIGAFERQLVTPSPWDAFLAGDENALTAGQKEGFLAFTKAACQTCHTGTYLGGHMYQKAGLVRPWPNQEDLGRGALTGNAADNMMFKVPSLRNIAKTGPYFHDGSVDSLPEAVKMMATHQLGIAVTDAEVASIVEFLGALTGEVDPALVSISAP